VFDALEVMVRNPVWSKTLDEYCDDFRRWLALGDGIGAMNLAIFYDAEATAGDAGLLRTAKQALIDLMRGERVRLARFARAIDAFPTPIGFFNNLAPRKRKATRST
jgi:CBS domain-containing protein